MAKNIDHLQHVKSNVVIEGKPKLPQPSALVEGELAVNYAKGYETISLKNTSGEVVTFSSDEYYTEQKLGSAFTGANSAVTVTDVIDNLDLGNEVEISSGVTPSGDTIELWVDESIEPVHADVYSKSETDALLDEKLDASAYTPVDLSNYYTKYDVDVIMGSGFTLTSTSSVTDVIVENESITSAALNDLNDRLSASTSAANVHISDSTIHVTSSDKTNWNAKLDSSDIADFFDDAEYDSSAKTINFLHGDTVKATIDATDFIKDGMVDNVEIKDVTISGETVACIAVTFNTDAGKEEIDIPITDIFDSNNYYTKGDIDDFLGSGFTTSSVTEVIESNERVIASALNDLNGKANTISGDVETLSGAVLAHTADTTIHLTSGDVKSQIDDRLGSGFTGINSARTVTEVIENDELTTFSEINALKINKLDVSAYTPTEEIWVSGSGENSAVLKGSSGTASGNYSVAEGRQTSATSEDSHAEGSYTKAENSSSHAEGFGSIASGQFSHAEGNTTKAIGSTSHAEGISSTASGQSSHAEGSNTRTNGVYSHAEGSNTKANGPSSHAEGGGSNANGTSSHAEGGGTNANGNYSHAEGGGTNANGQYSHAEGLSTIASGNNSHAEGEETSAITDDAHAEGWQTIASGDSSHAEGWRTQAIGDASHTEGTGTTASGDSSHAEGGHTSAMTDYSHAEGYATLADGFMSHAEGSATEANGDYSHAEGQSTIANNESEHASGQYNISSSASTTFGDSGNTLFSVGNGYYDVMEDVEVHHNAFEVRQNGDIYIVNKEGNDVRLQDEIGNIDVDQVIDSGTSASTNAVSTSAVYGFVTSYTPSITVDQVLDNTTSASTNPVSSKAVYDAVTDNELVWTNAYVTMSGAVSSHTSNNDIHVTAADKTVWNAKADITDIPSVSGYADSVKYNDTTHYMEFYHGTTAGTKVFEFDASPFIVDGMVEDVRVEEVAGSGTCLVIDFNTASGQEDINIPISDIFDANNYYDKTAIDDLVGSGFTSSSITEVIIENEGIVSAALNDLEARKLDASAYTPTDLSNYYTSAQTEAAITSAFSDKYGVISAVTVNSDLTNITCPASITGSSNNGAQAIVIYENEGSTTDYNISVSTAYKSPDGNQITLTCPKNGYCEVSYININGTIYARGI